MGPIHLQPRRAGVRTGAWFFALDHFMGDVVGWHAPKVADRQAAVVRSCRAQELTSDLIRATRLGVTVHGGSLPGLLALAWDHILAGVHGRASGQRHRRAVHVDAEGAIARRAAVPEHEGGVREDLAGDRTLQLRVGLPVLRVFEPPGGTSRPSASDGTVSMGGVQEAGSDTKSAPSIDLRGAVRLPLCAALIVRVSAIVLLGVQPGLLNSNSKSVRG